MTRSSNILFCQLEKTQADLHINYILGVALLWPYQKDTFDQERGLVFLWLTLLARDISQASFGSMAKLRKSDLLAWLRSHPKQLRTTHL